MSKLPYRPEGHEGSVEQYLPKVQNTIVKALTQAQKGLSYDTLRLDRPHLKALAGILVEFVEDLHCEIGIWRSLDRYNTEFFGTPLPFLFEPRTAFPLDAISPTRLQHFLWVLYPQLIPDLFLVPRPHRPGSSGANRRRSLTGAVRRSPQGLGRQALPGDPPQARLGSQAKADLARHRIVSLPHFLPAVH